MDYTRDENQKKLEDNIQIENSSNCGNSGVGVQVLFSNKSNNKTKFIDIDKYGFINKDKYATCIEKNNKNKFIDRDKLRLWDKDEDFSFHKLNGDVHYGSNVLFEKNKMQKDNKSSARKKRMYGTCTNNGRDKKNNSHIFYN